MTLTWSSRFQGSLCFDDSGELLTGQGLLPSPGLVRISIPADPELCGFEFSLQALNSTGTTPFVLSNALDFTVGM